MEVVRATYCAANRRAPLLFVLGLAGIAAHHARGHLQDRARATHRPQPGTEVGVLPPVDALVAAWNEADHIDAHIQSFLALPFHDVRLLLCAGGTDGTYARAAAYASPRVLVLEQHPGEGKQAALRRLLPHVTAEVLFFTDADTVFDAAALYGTCAPIAQGQASVVTGGSHPLPAQQHLPFVQAQWYADAAWRLDTSSVADGLLGRNFAVTRAALADAGDLEADVPSGTDYHLACMVIACGHTIRTAATSVPSRFNTDIRSHVQRRRRWVRNILVWGPQFAHRTSEVRAVRRGVAVSAGLLSVLFGLPLFGPLGVAGALLLLAYLCMVYARRVVLGAQVLGRPVPRRAVFTLPALIILDNVAVLLAWWDAHRGRTTW